MTQPSFQDMELQLLMPSTRRSLKELDLLLADDFMEIGVSGKIYSKQEAIHALMQESSKNFTISNFSQKELAANVVIVTYIACKSNSTILTNYSARTSIWQLRAGQWQIIFHQGTLISNKNNEK